MNLRNSIEYLYWQGWDTPRITEQMQKMYPERNIVQDTVQEMIDAIEESEEEYNVDCYRL